MKRSIHSLAKPLNPAIKRRKLNTSNSLNKKRKHRTRVIGRMDIKSRSQNYCIEIKEKDLYIEYYPNFYSSKESKEILNKLEEYVEYDDAEQSSVIIFGKKHQIPRKQTAFGDNNTSYKFSGNDVPSKQWKKLPLIQDIKEKIETQLSSSNDNNNNNNNNNDNVGNKFNFCLVNRYNDGNDKIGFHKDDERDLIENSNIAGISIGAERDIIFKHQDIVKNKNKNNNNNDNNNDHDNDDNIKSIKISLKNGSLFIMRYPTNSYWYHSIPKRAAIKKVRVSLTFRNMVPRTK